MKCAWRDTMVKKHIWNSHLRREPWGLLRSCCRLEGGGGGAGGDVHQKSNRTKTRQDPGKTAGRKERMAVKNQSSEHTCACVRVRETSLTAVCLGF